MKRKNIFSFHKCRKHRALLVVDQPALPNQPNKHRSDKRDTQSFAPKFCSLIFLPPANQQFFVLFRNPKTPTFQNQKKKNKRKKVKKSMKFKKVNKWNKK